MALAACFWAGGAQAQSTAPVGPDLRVGDLRGQFDTVFGNVTPPGTKAWNIIYGVGLSETYDDGVTVRNRFGADLITRISPTIAITANSSRIQGNIYYAPSLNLYTFHGNQTYIGQNLNGSLTGIVVPDLAFIDVRAYASQGPSYGGQTVTTYGSQGQVQTTSVSIAPRLEHRFGGTGTALLGDTLTRTETKSSNGSNNNANTATNTNATTFNPYVPRVVNGTSITNTQHANFTTGEDFGRFNDSLDLINSDTQGNGAVPSSHRLIYGTDASYALSRVFTLTGAVGHETINYGTGQLAIDDFTWSGGIRITPDPDNSLSLSYGHHDGANAFSLDATIAPTARSRVFLRYGQTIGTQQEQLQNNLLASRTSATGVSYDPVTGAPVQLNNNFTTGAQQQVYRTTTASATGVLTYDREVFTASIARDDQQVLTGGGNATTGTATTGAGTVGGATPVSSSGYHGSFAWTHTVSPDLFANATLQYSVRSAPFRLAGTPATNAQQTTLVVNLSLNYTLSQTVTALLQYTRINTTGATYGQPPRHDIATLSLQKTF